MNPVKGIDDRRNDYDDTQQFVSEQKQIARMAAEKSPARISHRRFATSCSGMRIIIEESAWKTVTVILKMKNVNTFRVIKWKKRQILTASFVTAH